MKITANFFSAGCNRFHPRYISSAPTNPGTEKPEEDYIDATKLARRLYMPLLESHLLITMKMPDDDEERVVYRGRSRTFNRNYWNLMFCFGSSSNPLGTVFGQGVTVIKDNAGTSFNFNCNFNGNGSSGPTMPFGSACGALGVTTGGIVIGTSLVEESFNRTAMGATIGSGNGAGQMLYTAQTLSTVTWASATDTFMAVHSRIFNNNSGGSIVVREVGMHGIQTIFIGPNPFLVCRDVLSSPVTVPNAAQLTVTYQISLTFPAGVVTDPPFMGGAAGSSPRVSAQGAGQPVRNWQEQRDPRNWQSTEQWQRQQYKNFKQ